jgi:type IV pilus assembly protein PilB
MSVLSKSAQRQVEEQLINDNLITKEKVEELREKAKTENKPLFALLTSEGGISDEDLTREISVVSKVPYVNLQDVTIKPEVLALLPKDIAENYMAVPLGEMQGRLVVAMLDAGNVQAVDFLSNRIGRPLKVYAASEEGIKSILKQYDATIGKQVSDTFGDTNDAPQEVEKSTDKKGKKKDEGIKTIVQDSPISKALTMILEYAAKNRASDIHIEPLENELKIRCRIDGVLREIMKLPKSTEPATRISYQDIYRT